MKQSSLYAIYLTVFIDLLGFGIILPALPFYAEHYGANGLWVGILQASYSAAQLLGAAVLGRVSDRIGRRPVILLSLLATAASLVLVGVSSSLMMLILGRALAGLFGGSIAPAQAYIADVTPPAERSKYMGMLGAAIGMGFVFGPAIGAATSYWGFSTGAYLAAILASGNFVFSYFVLKESHAPGSAPKRARLSISDLVSAMGKPVTSRIFASTFLATFAFVGMESTFALLGERRFGLTTRSMGLLFTFIGVLMAVVQGGLIGRLTKKFGERKLAAVGAASTALSLLVLPFVTSLPIAVVVIAGLALGQGLLNPTLTGLLSRNTNADEQGGVLGMNQSLAASARAVGPIVAGWLFDRGIGLPYYLGAGLTMLVVVIVLSLRDSMTKATTPIVSAIVQTAK